MDIDFILLIVYNCSAYKKRACSSTGRVPRSQCGGRGFEPLQVHQRARNELQSACNQRADWEKAPGELSIVEKRAPSGPPNNGALAQLGAHHTGSVGVRGSSPLCSTNNTEPSPDGSVLLLKGDLKRNTD